MAEIITFYALAVGISWIIGLPLYGPRFGIEGLPVLPHHHFLLALGPISAAFIATARFRGRAGVQELVGRIVNWRIEFLWYTIALFGPVVLFLAAGMIKHIYLGQDVDVAAFNRSPEFVGVPILALWLIHTLTFGLGEEVGWRGFLLPRLQVGRSALRATLLVALFSTAWHIPMFLYRPSFQAMSPSLIAGWVLSLALASILLTWLYNSTRGSVLIAILFHGSVNVAFTSEAAQGFIANAMGALITVWALVVLAVAGPRYLSKCGKHTIR